MLTLCVSAASTPKARGGANDRLQARLAKAMAGKAQGSGSPRSSFDSRPSMERPSMERPSMERPSMERPSMERASTDSATPAKDEAESTPEEAAATPETTEPTDTKAEKTAEPTEAKTEEIPAQTAAAPSSQPIPEIETPTTTTAPKTDISNLARDMEEIKARQQEEIQEYVERIDSLQSKLKYLSRSAAESAKKTATGAPSGSTERKLAEKDEKIALLMEEGQKLSGSEQTLRTTIKRLRLQMAERDKQADEVKKARDKAIADADALRSRLEGDEGNEKRQEEARKATASLQREIDSLKKERAARDEAARKAEQDLRAKADAAAVAAADAHAKALADEKSRTRELEDELATVRADRDAIKDKARLDGLEWSERLERAAERARTVEADLRNEVRVMENKLESMRAVAEEASSGAGGDAQVKLLRQIETLQSQYTTASDNWQGIEASLLAKVAGLEKEKDEAARRESDMRKKARESVSTSHADPVGLIKLLTTARPVDAVSSRRSCRMSSPNSRRPSGSSRRAARSWPHCGHQPRRPRRRWSRLAATWTGCSGPRRARCRPGTNRQHFRRHATRAGPTRRCCRYRATSAQTYQRACIFSTSHRRVGRPSRAAACPIALDLAR